MMSDINKNSLRSGKSDQGVYNSALKRYITGHVWSGLVCWIAKVSHIKAQINDTGTKLIWREMMVV